MNEAQFVHSIDGKDNLGDIESRDILRKDFILDKHGHQIATGQELHQHVKEERILESSVKLDNPWTVRLCQDISFRSNVGELVFLEHFCFYQRLHSIDLAVTFLLNKFNLAKSTLSDDLDGVIVLGLILGSQESQILSFLSPSSRPELLTPSTTLARVLQLLFELALSMEES